jgi:hypothetical protein
MLIHVFLRFYFFSKINECTLTFYIAFASAFRTPLFSPDTACLA